MTARLTSVGNVIIDVTLDVTALPERGVMYSATLAGSPPR
jgi:hypothetical protein